MLNINISSSIIYIIWNLVRLLIILMVISLLPQDFFKRNLLEMLVIFQNKSDIFNEVLLYTNAIIIMSYVKNIV